MRLMFKKFKNWWFTTDAPMHQSPFLRDISILVNHILSQHMSHPIMNIESLIFTLEVLQQKNWEASKNLSTESNSTWYKPLTVSVCYTLAIFSSCCEPSVTLPSMTLKNISTGLIKLSKQHKSYKKAKEDYRESNSWLKRYDVMPVLN